MSNQPFTGEVDLKNWEGFTPLKISGLPDSDGSPLPALRLNGFEWRIYHRPAKLAYSVASLAPAKN